MDPQRAPSPSISFNLHFCFFISKALQCSIKKQEEEVLIWAFSPGREYLAWARSPRYIKFQNTDPLAWARFSRSSENLTACPDFSRSSNHFLAWVRFPEFPKLKHWVSRLGETLSLKRESSNIPPSSGLLAKQASLNSQYEWERMHHFRQQTRGSENIYEQGGNSRVSGSDTSRPQYVDFNLRSTDVDLVRSRSTK
ncbi:hypothetical protein Lal_00022765 [Lupinus albus]|nr:hypothetical protein Lal_00022765 [Lupinus albus]